MSRYAYPNPGEAEAKLKQALALLDLFQDIPDPADEIARLRGVEESYAKIMGVVGAYMTSPEQLKGEAFRDIDGTYRVLSGQCKPDESRGWPACFEREADGRRKAEAEIDELRAQHAQDQADREHYMGKLGEALAENARLRAELAALSPPQPVADKPKVPPFRFSDSDEPLVGDPVKANNRRKKNPPPGVQA